MNITFIEQRVRDLFSTQERIEQQFGPSLSRLIRCRLAVLKAAPTLDLLPTQPPIGLTRIKGFGNRYAVALGVSHGLHFEACTPTPTAHATNSVTAITIIGVHTAPASKEAAR